MPITIIITITVSTAIKVIIANITITTIIVITTSTVIKAIIVIIH